MARYDRRMDRSTRLLVHACAWAWATGLATAAHAGTTGTSSGSDSGTSSSEGTTSSETDATTRGVDETGSCGSCEAGPGTIRFDTPSDDDSVDGPFAVRVVVTAGCTCVDCRCVEAPPEYTQLFLDTLAAGAPCYALECAWELNPTIGDHQLYSSAAFGGELEGTAIAIHVQSMAGSDSGGSLGDDGPMAPTDGGAPPPTMRSACWCWRCAVAPAAIEPRPRGLLSSAAPRSARREGSSWRRTSTSTR
jgi:hypothetical protein